MILDQTVQQKMKPKYNRIKLLLLPFILSIICIINGSSVSAASSKRNESSKSFFFTTPRGQTASVKALAIITEEYTLGGTTSIFSYRDCFLCYNREYSSSAPSVTMGKGVHKTSETGNTVRTFNGWTKGSYLWEVAKYPYGGGFYDKTSVSYPNTTTNVSGFSYTVYCNGALVPTQAGSVYVSLNVH